MPACRTHRSRTVEAEPEPLWRPEQALAVADAVVGRPERAETICLLVDDAYGPLSCVVIDGGDGPDDVLAVADLVAGLGHQSPVAHVVLVSVRPQHPVEPADHQRWQELDQRLAEGGVQLLEWFVSHHEMVIAITSLVGQPTRWWA